MVALSIILIYYNSPKEIKTCVKSLKSAVGRISYEIIIIDNNSPVALPKTILRNKKVIFIKNSQNKGYGAALNQGVKISKGRYLLLSNPDIIFFKNSLSAMVNKMISDSSIGILGPQILNQNKKILKVGSNYPFLPQALFIFSIYTKLFPKNRFFREYFLLDIDRTKEQEIPALAGACMLAQKNVLKKVKGFDERFFMYFEEADLCYRIKKINYKVLYYPKAKIIHFVGASSSNKAWIQKTFEKSRFEFFRKYHGLFPALIAESFLRTSRFIASMV